MKKIIYCIFIYIIFCLLQFSLGKYINICGIFPNFILILIVYLGLSKGAMSAQLAGFLFGLVWDAFSTDIFGARAVIFTIIGYFLGRLAKKFDRDKVYTQFVIVFLAGIAYLLGIGFIYYIAYRGSSCNYNFTSFNLTGAAESIVTALVAPVVFYILDYVSKDV
jgi:rod shape-determining protein MreD